MKFAETIKKQIYFAGQLEAYPPTLPLEGENVQ